MKKNISECIAGNISQLLYRSGTTLFLLFITFLSFAQPDTWQKKLPAGHPVRSAVGFNIGNKGYIGTGYSNEELYMSGDYASNSFWEYNPVTNIWIQKANYPGGATGDATGFSIGNKGYIANGTDFWEYDPIGNNWNKKADFDGIITAGASGFNIGNKGYIVTANATNNFWEYNPVTNSWLQKADFGGTPRSNGVGFGIGNKGYMGTGFNGTDYKSDFWEYDPSTNVWLQKADYSGGPISEATGFSIGSKGYIGTGRFNYELKNNFWEYNPAADSWAQKENFIGQGRYQATGFAIEGKGYIGTGITSFGQYVGYLNGFVQFDPVTDLWIGKADFGPAVKLIPQVSSVSFSIGNKGYICAAGYADVSSGNFWEYDPVTNTLLQRANLPGGVRTGAVGFSIGSKGYIGLGFNGTLAVRDFWEYNPETNVWTQKANFGGAGRRDAVGFSIAGKGYVGTGGDMFNFKKDFWEYNPATNNWVDKADFGGGERIGAVGFSIEGKGYIGTGAAGSGLTPKKDFWAYDPVTNAWTQKTDFGGQERVWATGFSIGNRGFIGTGNCCFFDFWEYNASGNTWIQRAGFGGGDRRFATGFNIGNKGYLGTGDGYERANKDLWEYTPAPENTITTNAVPAILYPGVPFNVPFTITGIYNAGNIFTAQLSNSAGNFTSPLNIGSTSSGNTITATIPCTTSIGSGYRIRVVSSNPVITGNNNGMNITVERQIPFLTCPPNIVTTNTTGTCGKIVNYNLPVITDNCFACSTPTSLPNYTFLGVSGGHSYFRSNFNATWGSADSSAKSLGAHLVTISNAAENNFVTGNGQQAWIGLTDMAAEGSFAWVTGEPFGYSNWFAGEPNNYGGNENYTVTNFWYPGQWNDYGPLNSFPFIIEFDCGAFLTQTAGLPSGSVFPVGVTTNSFSYTSPGGNPATCSFTVTVLDNQPPVLTCPSNIVTNATGINGKLVNYNLPVVSDNCTVCIVPLSIPDYTFLGVFGGHTYFRSNFNATWESANAAAQSLGAHLATLSNAAENNFIIGNGKQAWIGLTDKASEGNFVWVTGEPFVYNNWFAGEPNNSGNEDFVVTNFWYAGQWNDYGPLNTFPFVIEFDCVSFLTQTSGLASGSVFPVGVTTNTFLYNDQGGNTATCSFTVTVILNTLTSAAIDKTVPEKTMVVKAYPNPSAGDFNLEVTGNREERIMVRVLDVTGVVKSVQYLNTKTRTLKLGGDLPGGTYIVEVTQGIKKQVLKLVKLN